MSFFSWFRSKSEKSEQDELELQNAKEASETHADVKTPQVPSSRVAPPRLRETVPGGPLKPASAADSSGASKEGFRRPVRATLDVPLQALLQQLPSELTNSSIDIDPKRRVQIPRKMLVIDEAHQTATVTFSALFASCPDIFSLPIAPSDERKLQFNLPAWERPKSMDSTTAETGSAAVVPPPVEPQEKGDGPPAKRSETSEGNVLSDQTTHRADQPSVEREPAANLANPEERQEAGATRNGSGSQKTVRVALGPILKNLPAELRPSGSAALADKPGATVELPLDLIKAQLANGRVTIPFSTLLMSLPEDAKRYFPQAETTAEVPIPIKEILQEYPEDLLRLRSDQEPEESLPGIATPFTVPAQEDTERFSQIPPEAQLKEPGTDTQELELIDAQAQASESPRPESQTTSAASEEKPAPEEKPAAEQKPAPDLSRLQSVLLTDESLDLNTVVQKVSELPGINSALFFAADGALEGVPEKLGLTQSSVQLLSSLTHEVGQRVESLGFGQIETITLGWKRDLVSVFTRGEAGFIVRHDKRPFRPGVREKICLILSHISN